MFCINAQVNHPKGSHLEIRLCDILYPHKTCVLHASVNKIHLPKYGKHKQKYRLILILPLSNNVSVRDYSMQLKAGALRLNFISTGKGILWPHKYLFG